MSKEKTQANRNRWQLPFGFFAGPILWGLQLLVGYGLVTVACTSGSKLPVYFTISIAGLIVLIAGVVAYRAWDSRGDHSLLMETDQGVETPTFWAVSGFVVSTLFFLLIFNHSHCSNLFKPLPHYYDAAAMKE